MKMQLTAYAWEKIRHYVDQCEQEISGMGKVFVENGIITVSDVAIFEQTVSSAHSNISAETLAKFQVELIKKGEDVKNWCLWWHSHAKMKAFFSSTDTATIDSSTEFDYMVSLVTNHAHDIVARVDTHRPFRLHKDLTVEILETENAELKEQCKKDIEDKVSTKVSVQTDYRSTGKAYYGTGYQIRLVESPYMDRVESRKLRRKNRKKKGKRTENHDTPSQHLNDEMVEYERTKYFEEKEDLLEQVRQERRSSEATGDDSGLAIALDMLKEHVRKGDIWEQ